MPRTKTLSAIFCPTYNAFWALPMALLLFAVPQGCGELEASARSEDGSIIAHAGPVHQSLAPQTPGSCDLAGTWAAKFSIAVQWSKNLGLVGGEGHIDHWALIRRTQSADGSWAESVTVCGLNMPSYQSLPLFGSERYAMTLADQTFDQEALPVTVGQLHHDASQPEQTFAGGPYVFELGLALEDPAQQPFPTRLDALRPYVRDHDADADPGISMVPSTDGFVQPAVNMMRTRRAKSFHVAMRHILGAQGHVVDCDTLQASDATLLSGSPPTFESRTLGCTLTDGSSCTAGEATLATKYAPKYRVVGGSQIIQRRVEDTTTCVQIRAMTF